MVKRHTRPQQTGTPAAPERSSQLGGVIEREGPIHISNVMLLDAKGDPTRVRHRARGRQARARRQEHRRERSTDAMAQRMTADCPTSPPEDPLPGRDPPCADRALRLLVGDAGAAAREDHRSTWAWGLAKQDSKVLKAATEQLATIAGQQPSVRRARKSIAAFKLREGMPVGVAVTLRAERGYEFLDRLVSIAIPRIRDFRGLNPRSFDGRGNYSMGVKEQIIFPEIDYDAIDQVRGLDITITTTAATDVEAYALLAALGMPFAARGAQGLRPRGRRRPTAPRPPSSSASGRGEAVAEAERGRRQSRGAADDSRPRPRSRRGGRAEEQAGSRAERRGRG